MSPETPSGQRAVELGCGTAYVSAWMARRGARVSGIDLSERQLATARRLQAQQGLSFELLRGNCEQLPFAEFCRAGVEAAQAAVLPAAGALRRGVTRRAPALAR